MSTRAVLAIDQGTSGTKALLLGEDGSVLGTATRPVGQDTPVAGQVEQAPEQLWLSVVGAVSDLMDGRREHIAGIALSTQRESIMGWDSSTGKALTSLISWQDRRTAAQCAELATGPVSKEISRRSGLPVDPMFSAAKAAWLLATDEACQRAHDTGQLTLGTVESWLVRCLCGNDYDICEIGNAARTQLVDLANATWSSELLGMFGVAASTLPTIVPSTGPFGTVQGLPGVCDGTPVAAVLGDSHAALYAQTLNRRSSVKATYGSGSSLMTIEPASTQPPPGLSRTIAWQEHSAGPTYALEANIASAGTAVRWVCDLLGLDETALGDLAGEATEAAVPVLIPAFNGLGAPYWDRDAEAILTGFTHSTTSADLARAAIESIGFQVHDAFEQFEKALGDLPLLCADGGASTNDQLMQFQADLCARPVLRAGCPSTSALGAAYLAGAQLGMWTTHELPQLVVEPDTFVPARDDAWRTARLGHWRHGLTLARS